MTTATSKDALYLEGDIGMAAAALIQTFGDDATALVGEQIEDQWREGNQDGLYFWQAVADEISLRLVA